LTGHFHDFVQDEELQASLKEFNKATFLADKTSGVGTSIGKSFNENLEAYEREKESFKKRSFSTKAPTPIIPKTEKFSDFDPLEVARQLCLLESSIFQVIHPKELLNQSWIKAKDVAPTIVKLTKAFNDLAAWINTEIVNQPHERERIKVIKKFIQIMLYCRDFNNFNSVFEISAALEKSPIYRLKQSWEKLEKK